jgi:hypothetical protein
MTACERIREAREARAWAVRVDSETLAAALSIPRDCALWRAASAEWTRRESREAIFRAAVRLGSSGIPARDAFTVPEGRRS